MKGTSWAPRRRPILRLLPLLALLGTGGGSAQADKPPAPSVVVVIGAAGAPEYGERFARTAKRWKEHAKAAGAKLVMVGQERGEDQEESRGDEKTDREILKAALAAATAGPTPGPLWLVLIGHGTFDGRSARFNLRGPDVTATELGEWLIRAPTGTVVVNGASASAPFLKPMGAPGRIVITATKTGWERNATHFGGFFADALGEVAADLDRDGTVSVLEAFLAASAKVEALFDGQGLLTPEHALLDDTGDGIGTPASFYSGLARTQTPAQTAPPDGDQARKISLLPIPEDALDPQDAKRRDLLEQQLTELRNARSKLHPDQYYARLERILVELAGLYQGRTESIRAPNAPKQNVAGRRTPAPGAGAPESGQADRKD